MSTPSSPNNTLRVMLTSWRRRFFLRLTLRSFSSWFDLYPSSLVVDAWVVVRCVSDLIWVNVDEQIFISSRFRLDRHLTVLAFVVPLDVCIRRLRSQLDAQLIPSFLVVALEFEESTKEHLEDRPIDFNELGAPTPILGG